MLYLPTGHADAPRRAGLFLPTLLFLASLLFAPNAFARGFSLDFSQKNIRLAYGFAVGSKASRAALIDVGFHGDTDKNYVLFLRASVHGNVKGTDEGWRFGGGGQLSVVRFGTAQKNKLGSGDPQPHSVELFLATSWTKKGKVPIKIGFEINYSPEILSFGRLENKLSYYSYMTFEFLPSFAMRFGYQGYNYFFKSGRTARLNNRFFLGLDILF